MDIEGSGDNPVLTASPCHGSEKLMLNGVIFEEERTITETHCLRDMEGQQKRMTAVLASRDPLLPHNNY